MAWGREWPCSSVATYGESMAELRDCITLAERMLEPHHGQESIRVSKMYRAWRFKGSDLSASRKSGL